jgi:hypothetical protein
MMFFVVVSVMRRRDVHGRAPEAGRAIRYKSGPRGSDALRAFRYYPSRGHFVGISPNVMSNKDFYHPESNGGL